MYPSGMSRAIIVRVQPAAPVDLQSSVPRRTDPYLGLPSGSNDASSPGLPRWTDTYMAHFAIRLLFGIVLMLVLMPRRAVASGFFRVMMLVLLGLSVLFGLTTPGDVIGPLAMACLAFIGSVVWTLERRTSGTAVLMLLSLAALGELILSTQNTGSSGLHTPAILHLVSDLATSAILGGAMTGMLLGHRYLTAPGMPLAPLIRVNLFLGAAAACRLLLSAAALVLARDQLSGSTAWTFLALRWLAGIVGPLAVFVMVRQILKYRNTQAATGVLFVGVILTFIGELTADLLFHDWHIPM